MPHFVRFTTSHNYLTYPLSFISSLISKRLTKWVEAQGWSMENVVAFGDNFNDISMLEAAGTGVAMGNADDAVKARANIVIGDNTTDSIAQFIYSHLI